MSRLFPYHKKRKWSLTDEPKGKIYTNPKNQLAFVIQEHNARSHHYDLRLEVNGVLKSWAVPKGPSLDPTKKRLAIMVEDHPFEYRKFEGVIAKGSYGAGPVIVWDEGTYIAPNGKSKKESQKLIEEGLTKGHIDFILNGAKLHGQFSLVRIKNDSAKDNTWLLIKKNDSFASKIDITKKNHSVKSDRTIQMLEAGEDDTSVNSSIKQKIKKTKIPQHIHPMLCVLEKEPFDREGWLFEVKWDGYRAIAEINKKRVQLYSRNQLSFNDKFKPIVEELKKFAIDSAVLDGEIVILDSKGKSQFQSMQNYQTTQKGKLVYYVFDILFLNGYDLREFPLIERKKILKGLIDTDASKDIRFSDYVEKKGVAFFKKALKKNLEGMIAKDSQSTYQMKRSSDWIKIKTHQRQEVVVGGFTKPKGGREKFGSLLVGVYDGKNLVYSGRVGTGFSRKLLTEIYNQLEPLIQSKSPFKAVSENIAGVTWVKPKLVCEVSFTEWTIDNLMRHATFQGMRIDKNPIHVVREKFSKEGKLNTKTELKG